MFPNATYTHFFPGDSTTFLANLFQCLSTPSVKKFFLKSNLNLPSCNLKPFSLILLPRRRDRRPPGHSLLSGGCRILRCPLSLLFLRLNIPSSLSCSSPDLCSISSVFEQTPLLPRTASKKKWAQLSSCKGQYLNRPDEWPHTHPECQGMSPAQNERAFIA